MIHLQDHKHLWIPQIIDKLNQVTNPLPDFFHKPHALQEVIRDIGHLCGDNIYSRLQLLGENFYCSAPGSESIEVTTYIGAAVIP